MRSKKRFHEFAIYVDFLSIMAQESTSQISIESESLAHRLEHVLRMCVGQECILFDKQLVVHCIIKRFSKRAVTLEIVSRHAPEPFKPEITFLLPVLKREAFEEAVYSLVENGVSRIQPVITENIHRQWIAQKDMERLERIIQSAAEQAKYFAVPDILKPQPLSDVCKPYQGSSIFFDPQGQPLPEVIDEVRAQKPTHIRLLIGPESDLSVSEKEMIVGNGFQACALTLTILRARSAAALAQGIFRSIF